MNAQQLHNFIVKPTLKYMGGNYNSKKMRMLALGTAAVESNCGDTISQVGSGIAKGPFQMEDYTHDSIWENCDALRDSKFANRIKSLCVDALPYDANQLIVSPMYACAMMRLKYAMDSKALPPHDDVTAIYEYYKRIYNTPAGASTLNKFVAAWFDNGLDKVKL